MAKIDHVRDLDLYEILETVSTASVSDIKKAYRKKALKCHPDKNPDNPVAGDLFLELSKALEVLINPETRAAYDKIYYARKAAKIRTQELDSRRKKFKEELEARERAADAQSQFFSKGPGHQTSPWAKEIERLRKEGSRQLREEMELLRQQIIEDRYQAIIKNQHRSMYRLKIKWKSSKDDPENGGYNKDNLNQMFSKYGEVNTIVVSQTKKGRGLVEFVKPQAAIKALNLEKGLAQNPLNITWLTAEKSNEPESQNSQTHNVNVLFNWKLGQNRMPSDQIKPPKFPLFSHCGASNPAYSSPSCHKQDSKDGPLPSFLSGEATAQPSTTRSQASFKGSYEDFEHFVLKNMKDAERIKKNPSAPED